VESVEALAKWFQAPRLLSRQAAWQAALCQVLRLLLISATSCASKLRAYTYTYYN